MPLRCRLSLTPPRQTGIPPTTIAYWFDQPEFVALRAKTREDLAEETNTLAHKVLGKIAEKLDQFEPKDLAILYGILTDKGQLLSGQATSRTERRASPKDGATTRRWPCVTPSPTTSPSREKVEA